MNTRLKQFLSAESITQSQFADSIKVVRASVSHVLSGRNNPSYDFIKAIMSTYPQLNIEWLIFGKGRMYKEISTSTDQAPPIEPSVDEGGLLFDEVLAYDEPEPIHKTENLPPASPKDEQILKTQRKVRKVIILYDDDSYQEL